MVINYSNNGAITESQEQFRFIYPTVCRQEVTVIIPVRFVIAGPVLGMRHVQALLIFLNITTIFIGRLNVGVSVVAMTNAETTNPNFPVRIGILSRKYYLAH